MRYKTLTIRLPDEEQTYVVAAHVTIASVMAGEEDGVICHMVDPSKADLIAMLLNNYRGDGNHEPGPQS